jgi:NADPH:quinone reductase-like Zn-dependent oxidoreductase
VQSIGADHVIDYSREDFTLGSQRYDLIVDNVGSHTALEYRRVLNPKGTLVIVGGSGDGQWLGGMTGAIGAKLVAPFVSQKMGFFLAKLNHKDLDYLRVLLQDGKITPVIDRRYRLDEAPEAIRYLEAGHARGKVVINVE